MKCNELKKNLCTYEEATGQSINLDKSVVSFGLLVPEQTKVYIQTSLGIFKEGGTGSYLGSPECFCGSKVEFLGYIKDKLKSRMSGWFAKTLFLDGKEIF